VSRAAAAGWAKRGWPALALSLALLISFWPGSADLASAERVQHGTLIISLDGRLSPLRLPRRHPAPVAVHLKGGLQTSDGSLLPRATRIEIGLPSQGVLSTRGLPGCSASRLRDLTRSAALAACGSALVGKGRLRARVALPGQGPFWIDAAALAFNGRVDGGPAVILHAFAPSPPTVAVVPFRIRRRQPGRFGTSLAADLARSLGPWVRLSGFSLTLHRRYAFRDRSKSYLSASCPIPQNITASFFSFAQATFTFADGRRMSSSAITRGCRAM